MSEKDLIESKCDGCKGITHAMEANAETQAKEMLKLAALKKQVVDMQRYLETYGERVEKHESVFIEFAKAIAQKLD
ncbi:MAG: hypothetical protein EOO40_00585 [Deltaproteobacteria bacterium]|nr:MAG: hypothetical protein EOO40_00585 [Deltaproteobacteria bacterium]